MSPRRFGTAPMAANPILVLFAHPALERSRVNLRLVREIRDLPGITFHDLYEAYPDFQIEIRREQKLLSDHEVIVLQHPFYWYSAPSLVKEWLDLVLEHGWAYGRGGTALAGKTLLNAVTTGGPEEVYRPEGHNRFTMRQFLAPFDQTAHLCGMRYLAPHVVHKSLSFATSAAAGPEARRYRHLLELLRDHRLDLEAAARAEKVNDLLPPIESFAPDPSGEARKGAGERAVGKGAS